MTEADAFGGEVEVSGQEPGEGFIDGVRPADHQRLDAVGSQGIGCAIADPAADHGIGAAQQIDEAGVVPAGAGGAAADRG